MRSGRISQLKERLENALAGSQNQTNEIPIPARAHMRLEKIERKFDERYNIGRIEEDIHELAEAQETLFLCRFSLSHKINRLGSPEPSRLGHDRSR